MAAKPHDSRPAGHPDNKDRILKRLSRIEGQIRGISRMVAEDKYCTDIITQIAAAEAALDKTALELLRDHARHCLTANPAASTHSVSDEKADELTRAVARLLAR